MCLHGNNLWCFRNSVQDDSMFNIKHEIFVVSFDHNIPVTSVICGFLIMCFTFLLLTTEANNSEIFFSLNVNDLMMKVESFKYGNSIDDVIHICYCQTAYDAQLIHCISRHYLSELIRMQHTKLRLIVFSCHEYG